MACAGGVLRSAGHLQIAGMSASMAANMPQSYSTAATCASWASLSFLPASSTTFVEGMSKAANALVTPAPPPPAITVRASHGTA